MGATRGPGVHLWLKFRSRGFAGHVVVLLALGLSLVACNQELFGKLLSHPEEGLEAVGLALPLFWVNCLGGC